MLKLIFPILFKIFTKIQPWNNWNFIRKYLLRCLRLGTDVLLLLSACDVIFVKTLSPCHRLKAALCLARNLPYNHVALAARNIRKYEVK